MDILSAGRVENVLKAEPRPSKIEVSTQRS